MQENDKDALPEKEADRPVIHIDNFDGPLDLLWGLIKNARIEITDVSISSITEQYIAYLRLMDRMNVQVASDFIVMASELLYYKSRALLPGGEMEDEYFVPPLPPELVQRLLEFKKFQDASKNFRRMFELQADSYARVNPADTSSPEPELIEVSLFDLLSAFAEVMDSAREIESKEIVFDEILVSDRITLITELLKEKEQILFVEIFPERPGRAEIVATFLAVLEMAKIRRLRIMQHRVFGDIRLLRVDADRGADVPGDAEQT
ncbi:MAG TPA: segregation/condensation protein A [Spirochaetota bacterium]|nr:segregation/condensation protein A [Spirochaetota bacterium]OPZ37763.1 MAG: Segregation and condensation protein A [Spirochaetes bacterium ADurb.BinA120]HNU90707.1 segregation/condensation protein A [Spirochaetota bacterium]HPV96622.1 segregation/condensation protein A [Spirochaetota bacterium]